MRLPASQRCSGPPTRREFLRLGSLALGAASLPHWSAADEVMASVDSDTSVILFYMWGGPSQLETYDLKPEAPLEYRSLFRPIATNVPGMDICEFFPRQAKLADKFSLVRSLHHEINIHNDAAIEVLTGKPPSKLDPTSSAKSEHPDFAMVASRQLGQHPQAMPRYVGIPNALHMTRPTYLGLEHQAFVVGDPSAENFSLPQFGVVTGGQDQTLEDRRGLVAQLDRFRRSLDLHGTMEGSERFRELAFRMIGSTSIAEAFDLSQEDDTLRDRYGRHLWGQSCLMARRLAEAGTSIITIYSSVPKQGPEFTNWDDHPDNAGRPGHFAEFMRRRLPYMDQALSALIEDIYTRGIDRKVLLVAVGEFGRTPRISYRSQTGSTGRDHWPQAYTALVSGGGLRMGQVIGATNSKAEYPAQRPLRPQDLLATIYRHLNIDPATSLIDHSGRPIPILPGGEPIAELM